MSYSVSNNSGAIEHLMKENYTKIKRQLTHREMSGAYERSARSATICHYSLEPCGRGQARRGEPDARPRGARGTLPDLFGIRSMPSCAAGGIQRMTPRTLRKLFLHKSSKRMDLPRRTGSGGGFALTCWAR